jgi:hypothetical protein
VTGPRPQFFDEVFSAEVRDGFTGSLRRAYDTAAELHDPTRGSNEVTFGVGLYNFAVFQLGQLAKELSSALTIVEKVPFRIQAAGTFRLGCHRVGRGASDDIWSSFPDNAAAAAELIEQAYLPGSGFAPDLAVPDTGTARRLVLAHMGNPEDGLCAVYLCVPTREENGRIRAWGFAELLWSAAGADAVAASPDITTPEEVIEPVPLVKKKQKPEAEEK